MAKLTITDDSGRERAYLLKDAVTMAGRASSNAIQINDDKSSRQHFKIELRDDGYYLVDMGSTNGTRLNGSKVGLPTLLLSGDVIAVGKCSLIFNIYDNEVAKASVPGDAPVPISPEVANQPTMQAADFMEQVPAVASPVSQPSRANHPVYVLRAIEGALAGKTFELGD